MKKNHLDESIKAMGIGPNDVPKLKDDANTIAASALEIINNTKVKSGKGLIYGRIQSGKTRAMIASSALLFDEGVKIIVILTSNMNELVRQTYERFDAGLTQVSVLAKEHDLPSSQLRNKLALADANSDAKLMLVMPKQPAALNKTIEFLEAIDAAKYPVVIYDDEADQASLDTSKAQAAKGKQVTPSSTFLSIEKMREVLGKHVFIAVTGTPNANLLQDGKDRPDEFIFILKPGDDYVGGKEYFSDDIEDNKYVIEIHEDDKLELSKKEELDHVPESLLEAILTFVFTATLANYRGHISEKGKGYQFLCHPSHNVLPQENAYDAINQILNDMTLCLSGSKTEIDDYVAAALQQVIGEHGLDKKEWEQRLKSEAMALLQSARPIKVNSSAKNTGITYSPGLNILVGGNSLGRGVTIPNLISTYYTRGGRVSHADTLHQHARMFGYRKELLPYTKVYVTRDLYYRFKNTVTQDELLRDYIETKGTDKSPVPIVVTSKNLKPTRSNVLPTHAVINSGQKYPNPIDEIRLAKAQPKVNRIVSKAYGIDVDSTSAEIEQASKTNKDLKVSIEMAQSILRSMNLKGHSALWNPDTLPGILHGFYGSVNEVQINYRTSKRRIELGVVGGSSRSGMLDGAERDKGLASTLPTLWLHSIPSSTAGAEIIYPTLLLPEQDKIIIVSRD